VRSHNAVGLGVGLVSLALMHTQIVLTRIFSVVVWYHFAFFAISVALLGLGASALLVHARLPSISLERAPAVLAAASLAFGVSIVLLALFVLQVRPDWFGAGSGSFFTNFTPKLLAVFLGTTAPFFVGGFVISLALARYPDSLHRNYACDLGGAALACALVIPSLDLLGGPRALVASALFAALAAPAFASARPLSSGSKRVGAWLAAGGLVIALAAFVAQSGALEIKTAKGIDLRRETPEFNRWNSFSLVSVFPSSAFRGWGLSPAYTGPLPALKGLVIDMNAFTALTAFAGDFNQVGHTRYDLSALAFRVHPAPQSACIVGAGGGKDVLAALAAGSRHVTAVEVNPLIVKDVMRGRYRAFTGGLYDRDDVSVQIEDGRSFLRRSPDRYDVIVISMVDTSAATAAGAYALAENGLYTVNAFSDFLGRLRPGGMLSVSSVSLEGLAVGARLAALARSALRAAGRDPAQAVAVVETPWLGMPGATMRNLLIKPDGFSARDLRSLEQTSAELRFGLGYLPGRRSPTTDVEHGYIARILSEPDEAALGRAMAGWPVDVSAVDDDRPYFFYQNRLRDAPAALFARGDHHLFGNGLVILIKVLFCAILMVVACIALPLRLSQKRTPLRLGPAAWDLFYVGCIGLGYMFIEIGFIQKFLPYLGAPTHALTSVLFVLLLAGGAGSQLAASTKPAGVTRAFVALVAYALLLVLCFGSLATATAGASTGVRAVIAGASLAPLGLLMGMPLPSGLSAARARDPARLPWLWGVNAAASVLGSVLATLGSMHAGITALLLSGVALYVLAAVSWRRVGQAAP
jgi:hypothetical protein